MSSPLRIDTDVIVSGDVTIAGTLTDEVDGTTASMFIGAAAGAGAAAGGFGTDVRGLLTFSTGATGVAAGEIGGVDYGAADYTPTRRVVVSPANAATAALGLYVAGTHAWGFVVGVATAPAVSQPADTYALYYITS